MAILMEEQKKPVNVFAIIIVAFIISVIAALVYFLFFAPTPGFEIVVPAPLRAAREISATEVDPSTVLNGKPFRSLRVYTGLPTAGALGRDNPFTPF